MTTVDELLAALDAKPCVALKRLRHALDGDNAKPLMAAMRSDPRFGPPLQAICRDIEALDEMRYLVTFLGALKYAPAVPELLMVWRANRMGLSYQAGEALLAIGDGEAVRALADDYGSVKDRQIGVALDAVFRLGPTEAYERLAPRLDLGKPAATRVLGQLTPEQLDVEPRWRPLLVRAVREGDRFSRLAAARVLQRALAPAEVAELFPSAEPTVATAEQAAAYSKQLDKARDAMGKLRDALPDGSWREPPKSRARQLSRLEEAIGPLPAFVRAFYQLMDGLSVPASNNKKPFVIYGLDHASKGVKAWKRAASPIFTPPFLFAIAPDAYTLAGYSGGPDVGFEMPCEDADPRLVNMSRPPRFAAFVRRARRAHER